jgi:ectoine hydroxylase-related dioxygenase (phytanoyl-CoA dioxygenase family)
MDSQQFKYQKGMRGRGLVASRRFLYGARALVFSPVFLTDRASLLGYRKPVNDLPTQVMNDICNATNGKGLERGSRIIARLVRKQTRAFDETIPKLKKAAKTTEQQRAEIVASLRETGFAVIPSFLPEKQAREMYKKMLANPGRDRKPKDFATQQEWLSDHTSPRIDANRETTAAVTDEANLDFASLQLIAREYLKCRPLQLGPNSWTTKAIPSLSTEAMDNNAMAFHSDSDYFGFVKAFMLLTDVNEDSGPFTFIAGSHLQDRQVQGRRKDSDLGYQASDVRLGMGKPGDLVLAVTTGWHKASVPKKGHRMMIQWMFTNSLFGSATQ